jgi:hypothetical protein
MHAWTTVLGLRLQVVEPHGVILTCITILKIVGILGPGLVITYTITDEFQLGGALSPTYWVEHP